MTEHRTMNTIIHAAIRRDIARFDAALATFPAGSQQRAEELTPAWKNFALQIHQHHDDEETIFWRRSTGAVRAHAHRPPELPPRDRPGLALTP